MTKLTLRKWNSRILTMLIVDINNIKRIFICSSLLLFQFSLFSQISIHGEVKDQNGQPIPYAHIYLSKTVGSITNHDGRFKLYIPDTLKYNQPIRISAIGYQIVSFPINKLPKTIILRESEHVLGEVVVIAQDYAREIIDKAIIAIPRNYPSISERHVGFVREQIMWEGNDLPMHIAESVIEAIKQSYEHKRTTGEIKVLQLRKYKNAARDSLAVKIYGGAHHIHRFDIVAGRKEFLSHPEKFDFRLVDTIRFQSKNLFKLKFSKDDLSGYVYVLDSTYAITKAEFHYTGFSPLNLEDKGREFLDFSVWYEMTDSLWRFKNSNYRTGLNKFKRPLTLSSEYTSTSVIVNNQDIPYLDRLHHRDILLDDSSAYDPEFWDQYNIIESDDKIEGLFKKAATLEQTYIPPRLKVYNFLSLFQMRAGIVLSSLETHPHSIDYNNVSLQVNSSTGHSKDVSWSSFVSYDYALKNRAEIGLAIESPLFKTGITSYDLLLMKGFNLNPKGRPVVLSLVLKSGYQVLTCPIDLFNSSADFVISEKKFDSRSIDVWMAQRNFRIQPQVQLSVEKTSRISFIGALRYNKPLSQQIGLMFIEREGFFLARKKQFLKNGHENLMINAPNNSILENNFSLSLGVNLSL